MRDKRGESDVRKMRTTEMLLPLNGFMIKKEKKENSLTVNKGEEKRHKLHSVSSSIAILIIAHLFNKYLEPSYLSRLQV